MSDPSGSYRQLVAQQGVVPALLAFTLGGLPVGLVYLSLILTLQERTGLAFGAAAAAAYSGGSALAAPALARAVSRHGARRVLVVTAIAYPVALIGTVLAAPVASRVVLLVTIAVAGASVPPVAVCVQAGWVALIEPLEVRRTAFAVQQLQQELFYVIGPLLAGLAATLAAPTAGLVLAAACGSIGALLQALTGPALARADVSARPARPAGRRLGPLSGLAVTLAATLGFVELAAVSSASSALVAGLYSAAWSGGSVVGGLAYGTWARPIDERRHLAVLVGALALGTCVAAATASSGGWVAAGGLAVAGLGLGPTIAALFAAVPARTVRPVEAFGWLSLVSKTGTTGGLVLAGVVVVQLGPAPTHLIAAAALAVACGVWLATEPALEQALLAEA